MKTLYVLPLSDASATLEIVGGKGMSLARMADAGFPVPDGFHVTTEAYRTFIRVNDLQQGILAALKAVDPAIPGSLEAASETILRTFAQGEMPPEVAEAIRGSYEAIPQPRPPAAVAVRSSATAEDLPEASFAGQQETYLNVSGLDAVLAAVKKCWASLWTARAIAYRIKNNIDQDTVALAVVVQEMVEAEAAGILFTANPINGRRDEMVINAAWGLGEAIVGGLVSPDTIVAEKATGKVKKIEVADKTIITVATGTGTEEIPLTDERRKTQVLKDAQVVELVSVASRIEDFYGKPQDIEWCRAKGSFYIVQSRPITALPEPEVSVPTEWRLPKGAYAAVRNNIVELMADPLSPLFATLGLSAINTSLHRIMDESFGMRGIMPQEIILAVNHYAYNNGSVSAKGMGRIIFGAGRIMKMMFSGAVERWTMSGRPRYHQIVENWEAKDWRAFSALELLDGARQLTEAAIDAYAALVSGVIPAAWITEALFTSLYKRLIKRRGDPSAPTFLLGFDSLPIRADKSLYSLAEWAREYPELADHLEHTSALQLAEALGDSRWWPDAVLPAIWQEWQRRFHQHLKEYGYTIYDLDFAHHVPADDPTPLLETFKLYLRGQGVNPYARQEESEEKRENEKQAIVDRLKGWRLNLFRKYLGRAQKFAPLREDGLAEIGLAYPLIRQMLRELGGRLAERGAISAADDIFWMTQDEVLVTAVKLDAGMPVESMAEKIPQRRAELRAAMRASPPMALPQMKILGFDLMSLKGKRGGGKRDVIKGVAASPGKATGVARVLHGPEDFSKMRPGDVLVAPITTPAWTPLFAMASGIVTDVGGPLSHGSIVAREYGIPAVLGTGVGTRRLHSGDIVEVDGTEGRVWLKEQAGPGGEAAVEWVMPNPKAIYTRGSLAEHLPNAVSPLFATLGLRAVNESTIELGELMGIDPVENEYQYRAINGYVYMGFKLTGKFLWVMVKTTITSLKYMLGKGIERWREARSVFAKTVAEWEEKDVKTLSPTELFRGARELMISAGRYYTVIQSGTLPNAGSSELIFTSLHKMLSRKDEPKAETLLFGLETLPLRAEKSQFDLGMWIRERPALLDFVLQTPTGELVDAWEADYAPELVPAADWSEFKSRFGKHLDEFGHTSYEFDFMNPTPAETPGLILDAVKMYVEGRGSDPYARQREAVEKRDEQVKKIHDRVKLIPNRWFNKVHQWAMTAGPAREDSLADMGMGHTAIRRLLGELGRRIVQNGAFGDPEDIYWLEAGELDELVYLLERSEKLPDQSERIQERKAQWRERMKLNPPAVLPRNSSWAKLVPWARENTTSSVLQGLGASAGKVTATARVLFGPQDFGKMKPGDVLVAVATTPAWTPLFTMASAIVTDIGGPLSHSSIVAREYGIPAVLATGIGTRRIQDGQTITVDGSVGTVELR